MPHNDILAKLKDAIAVFIADRGFCSYNNIAHVMQRGQFFLFRAKDIHSKGLLHYIDFPSDPVES